MRRTGRLLIGALAVSGAGCRGTFDATPRYPEGRGPWELPIVSGPSVPGVRVRGALHGEGGAHIESDYELDTGSQRSIAPQVLAERLELRIRFESNVRIVGVTGHAMMWRGAF